MSNIKVVVLSKNEYDLMEDFIQYYGYIFGIANIVVVDNGSTDARVLDVYQRYTEAGLTVIRESRSFDQASSFMTEHIRSIIDASPTTEWVLCLETDEFLFWVDDVGAEDAVTQPQQIVHYLQNVPQGITYFRYEKFLGSIVTPNAEYVNGAYRRPAASITEFYDQNWDKFAVRAKAFVGIHQWPHRAAVSYGNKLICKELGLLHLHNTGKRRLFEKACNVLESIGVCANIQDKFYKDPIRTIKTIETFHNQRASHGHKAAYVLDVLYRMVCWHMFHNIHGITPDILLVNDAVQHKNLDRMEQRIVGWQDKKECGKNTYDEVVYIEDARAPEYHVHVIGNTLRLISKQE